MSATEGKSIKRQFRDYLYINDISPKQAGSKVSPKMTGNHVSKILSEDGDHVTKRLLELIRANGCNIKLVTPGNDDHA